MMDFPSGPCQNGRNWALLAMLLAHPRGKRAVGIFGNRERKSTCIEIVYYVCMAIEDCNLNKQEHRKVNRILITHICLSDLAVSSCSSAWGGRLQYFVLPSHSRSMEFLTQWQWLCWINAATFATWPPLFSLKKMALAVFCTLQTN